MARPMLDTVELQQVQQIDTDQDQVLVQHAVPALEGDFLQGLGRRATRVTLNGVLTGPEVADGLKTLREKFNAAQPMPFVSDITTATKVDQVLIEEMGVREVAGKPQRFEYSFTLREFTVAPATQTEEPPENPPEPPDPEVATLEVEVVVEGDPNFDFSNTTVTVEGTQSDGTSLSRTLTQRQNNVWTERNFPAGQFTARAVVPTPAMSGTAPAVVHAGQTTHVIITLQRGQVTNIAKAFVVHFRFDKAFVEPCMRRVLRRVIEYAAAHSAEKLLIVGHTDKVGSDAYNLSLGDRRARSIYAYLTFGRDATARAASLAEWNALRVQRPGGELPSVKDSWGTRQYQYMLQDLRFYPGNVDGDHGPQTTDAVRAFQQAHSLADIGTVDDATWAALIEAYLSQDETVMNASESMFLPNCPSEILKWISCGEQHPRNSTPKATDPGASCAPTIAWRPNRRTELLFVTVSALPQPELKPVTFDLAPAVGTNWCVGPTSPDPLAPRCTFLVEGCSTPAANQICIVPAEPDTISVNGSIVDENGVPLGNMKYVLIAPDGEFMDGEKMCGDDRGIPKPGRTRPDGTFTYTRTTPVGIYTMEVELPSGPHIAHVASEPPATGKGSVVCKRLTTADSRFDVIVRTGTPSSVAVNPIITLASAVVVVKKSYTNPARQLVTLSTSSPLSGSDTGTFTRSSSAVHFFTAAVGGTEITFNGTDNVFTGAQLAAGMQLFAEGASPSAALDDVQLTLTLSSASLTVGPPAIATMTAVELTLDICVSRTAPGVDPVPLSTNDKINVGRFVLTQDPSLSHERAMLIVRPPNPPAFVGTLELTPIDARVQAFIDETPAAGQTPLLNPHTFQSALIPVNGLRFFAEGVTASNALRDTGFRLGVHGLENDADHATITVLRDPSLPGLFPVGEHEYTRPAVFSIPAMTETLSDLTLADSGASPGTGARPTGAYSVHIRALVRYPASVAGVDTPVSTALPRYPLIVIAHGNHRSFSAPGVRVESFRGLEYLARHLASYGYIAISIDLEEMNIPVSRDPDIVQRGLTILEHIDFWNSLNATDPIFAGKVDLTQVGLIGHSRGGEAVVSAQKSNVDTGRGLAIRAVASIAPTDFLGIIHSTTPYLVIYGSADGDVSIGWPFRLYDRAFPFKCMFFVYGAIHNRFSTSPDWLDPTQIDSTDARMISAADHLNIAKGFCLGFLQLQFRGVGDHMSLFKNNARLSAVSGGVEIHNQVQDVSPRLTVDNYEQGAFDPALPQGPQLAARATTSTLGESVAQTGLVVPSTPLTDALTEASLRHRELAFFWHDTFGGLLTWDAVGGTYTQPLGTKDVSTFQVLSFRATQRFGSARNPAPPSASPDFSIVLVDTANQTAAIRVTAVTALPVPYLRLDNPSLTKSALTTIRIPLSKFTDVNAALNLHLLKAVVFQFDQTVRGEIAIDDLEFSN